MILKNLQCCGIIIVKITIGVSKLVYIVRNVFIRTAEHFLCDPSGPRPNSVSMCTVSDGAVCRMVILMPTTF